MQSDTPPLNKQIKIKQLGFLGGKNFFYSTCTFRTPGTHLRELSMFFILLVSKVLFLTELVHCYSTSHFSFQTCIVILKCCKILSSTRTECREHPDNACDSLPRMNTSFSFSIIALGSLVLKKSHMLPKSQGPFVASFSLPIVPLKCYCKSNSFIPEVSLMPEIPNSPVDIVTVVKTTF